MTALRNHFTSSCLETYPRMRTIAERFACRLSATTQGSTHLHTFLSELIMQPYTTTECDGPVFDTGDGYLARTWRCCNFRNFENFARIEKLHVYMPVITHRFGTGMSTAAQAQVVSVLNPSVLVNQSDIAGNLQRSTIGDEHFIGYFQQARLTLAFLPFHEPPVERFGRGGQVFMMLFRLKL